MYHCKGSVGTPIDFYFTKKEAPIIKVIQSLVTYKPKQVDAILFDHLNSDYMNQCYWILKWSIESYNTNSFMEQDYQYDDPMVKACRERAVFMIARLHLCKTVLRLFKSHSYNDWWHFWLKVEIEWKNNAFELTNIDAENRCSTKTNIDCVNRKFVQLLKQKKNPYIKSINPHLFKLIDDSLKKVDYRSILFSMDFLKYEWNPFLESVKNWFNIEKNGFISNDTKPINIGALNYSADKNTLTTPIGGRKNKVVYQKPRTNFSRRGRKKENKNYDCADFLSSSMPEDFGDLSYLEYKS